MSQIKIIPGQVSLGSATGLTGDGTINAQGFFKEGSELLGQDNISDIVGTANGKIATVNLTTTNLTNVFTYTGSGRALLTGILVSNIEGVTESQINAVINDNSDSATDFTITGNMPVPAGTSVELLRKPKVLEPNDIVKLQASDANFLNATLTIAEFNDDTSLFSAFNATGTTEAAGLTAIYTESNTNGSVIDSILLSTEEVGINGTLVDVSIYDGVNDFYLTFNLNVPEKTTVEICESPKHLENGSSIRVKVSEADKITVSVSGRQI